MAQRRSAGTALDYVRGLAPGVTANCWGLAEAAGHQGPYRMQALLRSYRWDWKDLRAELPGLARAWLPCDPGDLTGPGIAVDETAQLKDGDATACVAPQHAGCTGHVENCVTTVFSAWVTTSGQAWADFDVFMPGRWEKDWQRRRAAGIPGKLERKTKPQLAIGQLERLLDAGLPAKWAAYDEVYGRSGELRRFCESRDLAYVAVIPRDFRVTLPSGAVVRADEATGNAAFERRSCGNGAKGPRFADWALTATTSPRHVLLIRRLISRPDDLAFYLCWSPEGTPATMTFFITIAGRRWPCEQTFKTGKDVLGWDQSQARAWDAVCRHTALAALAQLRQAAIRSHLCGDITLPGAPAGSSRDDGRHREDDISGADLRIPLGDAPVPSRGGQPCPPRIAAIRLTIAETARLERLARQHAAGLITRARLAFHLRWSAWRRRHQARARWHHYSTRLLAEAAT
jgi:SRSO17 transposase